MLSGFEKILLTLLLLVLMTGMGATLSFENFREVVRKPKGPIVGFLSQFGWMPLISFTLAYGFSLRPEFAIGLIIVGCTPAGTTSNLFTYFSKADVALSISMTILTTFGGVVMMPVLLYLYATPFTSQEIKIPYGSIVITLLLVLVPVVVGILIRKKSPAVAKRVEKAGSLAGIAVLILLIISSLVRNIDLLKRTTFDMFLCATLLGAVGFLMGYISAKIFKMSEGSSRAVAFETGIQNSPLAFGIIIASFQSEMQVDLLWLPMLYALMVLLSGLCLTLLFRGCSKTHPSTVE